MMPLLILACASPDGQPADSAALADTPVVDPVPAGGVYTVEAASRWEGDCNLSDEHTYDDPEQEWTFDPRGDALVLFPDFWNVIWCELAGMDFTCDVGSFSLARIEVDYTLDGTFSDDAFAGAYVLDIDCAGSTCAALQDYYREPDMAFPCHLEAPVSGVLTTPM